MRPDYFEGILQLRNPDSEVIDFVSRQVAKRNDVRVSKVAKVRNGIDMYFSSQRYLRILGKKLKVHFPGEMIMSSKLFTKSSTGIDLYRVNVLFRLSRLKKGEIITYRGRSMKIMHLGSKVTCKYMDTGRSITLSYDLLSN